MQDIKFSVIVSIFNIEKYLKRCLDSIINQTYKNLEIILIDDGSTDSSPLICDEYSKMDCRIKVVHKKNEGLGFARNTGLEIASGDYIAFIDGDDFVSIDLFSECEKILSDYLPDIIDFDYQSFKNGKILRDKYFRNYDKYICGDNIIQKLLLNMIYNYKNKLRLHDCTWNKIYSLSFLKNIDFKFVSERIYISEDYYSNLILYSKVQSVYLSKKKMYYYCFNSNSLTHLLNTNRLNQNLILYDKSIELSTQLNYPKKIKSRIYLQVLGNLIGHIKIVLHNQLLSDTEKKNIIMKMLRNKFFFDGYNITIKEKVTFRIRLFLYLIYKKHFYFTYLILKKFY